MFVKDALKVRHLLFLVLAGFVSVSAAAQARKMEPKHTPGTPHILKGSIGFPKNYSPQKGDRAFLRGVVVLLMDKVSKSELGRAVTEADGNFVFPSVTGNGTNLMNAKEVCIDGKCFDYEPLPSDPPPPMKPIEAEDPPLQEWKNRKLARPMPPLVLEPILCTPQGGGPTIRMAAKAAAPIKPTDRHQ